MLEYGEYDERTVRGPFRVLKDFDEREAFRIWRSEANTDIRALGLENDTYTAGGNFVSWLKQNRYVESMLAEAIIIETTRDPDTGKNVRHDLLIRRVAWDA